MNVRRPFGPTLFLVTERPTLMYPRPSDFHHTITDRIVLALEADPGRWQRPWSRNARALRPANIESRRPYQGINVIALWAEAQIGG